MCDRSGILSHSLRDRLSTYVARASLGSQFDTEYVTDWKRKPNEDILTR
jgi:hypothetical protein